jgi:hypothetical protein
MRLNIYNDSPEKTKERRWRYRSRARSSPVATKRRQEKVF